MDGSKNKKVLVIHGPNLNLLGRREPELYGTVPLQEVNHELKQLGESLGIDVVATQSNGEGEIVDRIQQAGFNGFSAIIINPAGYSNTSIAIRDAIAGASLPTIEVHVTNVFAREAFRQNMMTAGACKGMICGLGANSYHLALRAVAAMLGGKP